MPRLFPLLLLLTSCQPANDPVDTDDKLPLDSDEADADTDADSDADTDADGDADGDSDADTDPCGPVDTSVPTPYPIAGYWMYSRGGECGWKEALEQVHRLGADTVIQFGAYPLQRSEAEIAADASFAACIDDGVSCYQAALTDLVEAHPANSIHAAWTFGSYEDFGDHIIACPAMEKRIDLGDTLFWRLLLPSGDPSDRGCDFSAGQAYDLVLVSGRGFDLLGELFTRADQQGMEVWAGVPSVTPSPSAAWDVWSTAQPLALELQRRILGSWQRDHAHHSSFVGVYQSFELPVASPTVQSVLDWYSASNAVVHAELPGARIMASPYVDLRRSVGVSTATVAAGAKLIARTGFDVLAPQDGRGTGKVGLYWPYEQDSAVDPRLEPAVGATTYGLAYHGTTTDLYLAVAEALDELADDEGLDLELWANLEAFEPGSGEVCGEFSTIQRTHKERLDQALTFEGARASRVVSFMWDSLYTCAGGESTTLGEDLALDAARPIIAEAFRWDSGGTPGVVLRGYGLDGSSIGFTWYDSAWVAQGDTQAASQGALDSGYGAAHDEVPDGLQELWLPFDWSEMAPDFYLHLSATGAGGTSHHPFSLAY